MAYGFYPPEKDGLVPLAVDDFLRRGRVGLLMWDMQNGLAGKAPTIDRITHNAKRLLASADKAAIPVFWSSTFFRRSTRQPVPSCSFS